MNKMRVYVIAAALVLAVLAGCVVATPGVSPVATPSFFEMELGGDPVDVPALPDFLEMLAGPVGWVVLGAVFSSLLAKWTWYNAQGDALKRGLILGLSMLLAIGARLLITYVPPVFWEQTAVYWYIVYGVAMTWLGSQGWFKAVVKPRKELERTALILE